MDNIKKQALLNSILTTLYIFAVGAFMYYGSAIKIGNANAFLAPIALLMLFVLSAAITGYLIFGRPALMYIDGKKKEALSLLFATLGFLSGFTLFFLLLLIFLSL